MADETRARYPAFSLNKAVKGRCQRDQGLLFFLKGFKERPFFVLRVTALPCDFNTTVCQPAIELSKIPEPGPGCK